MIEIENCYPFLSNAPNPIPLPGPPLPPVQLNTKSLTNILAAIPQSEESNNNNSQSIEPDMSALPSQEQKQEQPNNKNNATESFLEFSALELDETKVAEDGDKKEMGKNDFLENDDADEG